MSSAQVHDGPPYLPTTAGVGGRPTIDVDVPILSVLLVIYIIGAVTNMTILQLNNRRGHKFLMSGALFGFCMCRTVTSVLRIAWANKLSNERLAIAAQIFTNAGVLIFYIVSLLLSLRVFRALHPEMGWNKTLSRVIKVMYVLIGGALVLFITFTVLSFYTLNHGVRTAALWIQRGALLYMLMFNLVSTTLFLLSVLLPRSPHQENFGAGSMRSKLIILAVAVFFLDFIIGFRTGTIWAHPHPISDPAWYDSKEAFYIIELGFELVVLYTFTLTRIDKRFWVPNGSKQPGDYSRSGVPDSRIEEGSSSSDLSSHSISAKA